VVIAGVGHVSNFEAPERFNAEVRSFFRSAKSRKKEGEMEHDETRDSNRLEL
jgi:hypothetical protein